jgi:hypothetical protein
MAHRIVFWKPKAGINVWLPANRPLGERILDMVRRGKQSDLLQDFPATAFLSRLALGFPGSRFDDEGLLHWTDELDNGFVAKACRQHVEVCSFDAEDDHIGRVFQIAEKFACEHYDWGN